jgi:hypothetical protein
MKPFGVILQSIQKIEQQSESAYARESNANIS